jgi:ParB family chromosome partitioning protein
MGHGRALLAVENAAQRKALGRESMKKAWSVRELERRIRALRADSHRHEGMHGGPASETVNAQKAHVKDLETRLGQHLGREVSIAPGRKKGTGTLTLSFYSMDDFDQMLHQLGVSLEDRA